MTISPPLFVMAATVLPIIVFIFIARMRADRRRRAAGLAKEGPVYVFQLQPEPQTERTPLFFVRHFTRPQRTYLNHQLDVARILLVLCSYLLFVVASVGLLPRTAGQSLDVWERYQNQMTWTGYVAEVFSVVAAITVVTALKTPAAAKFNRTRPLSFRLLFFGRALILLASLLAATQAALLASIFFLLLIYGPTRNLASIPLHSICRLDLSMVTTTALTFSVFVLVAFIPRPWSMTGSLRFIPIFFGAMAGSQAVRAGHFLLTSFAARILFVFPAQGPALPYTYALVPIGCVVALLLLSERLSSRLEI